MRVSRDLYSLFFLHIPNLSVLHIEDKQTRHIVSFDPANFRHQKYIKAFSVMPFGPTISQYLGSHFTEKQENRFKNFFPALNCNLVDFFKYQEIDVQIQAFTDEN